MNTVTSIGKNNRIAGTWKYCDGFSDVEFAIAIRDGAVVVSAIDTSDGEIPEILEVKWSERELVLSFAAYWSHGRLVKYQIAVGPNPDRLQATITSTCQELWERQ